MVSKYGFLPNNDILTFSPNATPAKCWELLFFSKSNSTRPTERDKLGDTLTCFKTIASPKYILLIFSIAAGPKKTKEPDAFSREEFSSLESGYYDLYLGDINTNGSISYSKKVLRVFKKAKKKLVVVKKGDHSLSSKKWLKILIKELNLVI